MSLFDKVLGAAHDHPTVKNLAEKLGIDQETAEKAIAALAAAHKKDGDTVEVAHQDSGIEKGVLEQVLAHIGGEGSLAGFMQILDKDHASGGLSGIFGEK